MSTSLPPVRRDWLSKTLAGVLLGCTLALGSSGLFASLSLDIPMTARGQLAMWMVSPIALLTLGCVYFFRSGMSAWLWLGAANMAVFGVLAAVRLS